MKSVVKYLIVFILSILSFFLGMLYFPYQFKKFYESSIGSSIEDIKNSWGNPDEIEENTFEIIYTYYPIIPVNEYKFFFNKEDKLLVTRWKEY